MTDALTFAVTDVPKAEQASCPISGSSIIYFCESILPFMTLQREMSVIIVVYLSNVSDPQCIIISEITEDGAASKEGSLCVGDQIIKVSFHFLYYLLIRSSAAS